MSTPPVRTEAFVLQHREVAPAMYWMVLQVGAGFGPPAPGQFVFLKVTESGDPFLRRPMSIAGFREKAGHCELDLFYRVVGRGTRILAGFREGDRIDLLGPLGRAFRMAPDPPGLLVGGGMGVAPLLFLARRRTPEDVFVVGCRSAAQYPADFLGEKVATPLHVATEDGSRGMKGLASDLADKVGSEQEWRVQVFAAGPSAMLAAVARLAAERRVACQVLLEARMACGVGSCLGCVVPVRGGETYRRVCREGPVFNAEDILWEALADKRPI